MTHLRQSLIGHKTVYTREHFKTVSNLVDENGDVQTRTTVGYDDSGGYHPLERNRHQCSLVHPETVGFFV